MISVKVKGDWDKTTKWLDKIISRHNFKVMEKYGREGVAALSTATPVDTGTTASSWDYRIDQTDDSISLVFVNSNIDNERLNIEQRIIPSIWSTLNLDSEVVK